MRPERRKPAVRAQRTPFLNSAKGGTRRQTLTSGMEMYSVSSRELLIGERERVANVREIKSPDAITLRAVLNALGGTCKRVFPDCLS